jgi:uncharacterized membrane protein (GlpM family)
MSPRVQAKPQKITEISWKAYAVRFAFGGAITALAGWIASTWGPVVGGLFLAFPAILPASVTLVRRHEDADAAARDAYGAMMGSLGLLAFGLAIWLLSNRAAWPVALLAAAVAWLTTSVIAFWIDDSVRRAGRAG